MTNNERVRDGAIFWLANHYTISTEAVHIERVTAINQDDWQVRATCTVGQSVKHVELKVFCDSSIFDVLDFYQIGACK
jgi:hypothetical protein